MPVGRISGDDLIEFAKLAKQYGTAELRLTVQQNVLIPNVPAGRVPALLAEPLLQKYSPTPSAFIRSMVTCTGNDYCAFALIDTKGEALRLADALEQRYSVGTDAAPVQIRMSGCPHACGVHRSGEIGLLGGRKRIDGAIIDVADIFAGGRLGDDAVLGERTMRDVAMGDLPELIAEQIRAIRGADALIDLADLAGQREPILAD